MMTPAAIVAALEAVAAGDVREAEAILLDAIEEDGPRTAGVICPGCGQCYDWPGLLEAHRFNCWRLADAEAETS